jgi:hypothetical protein
MVVRPLGSFEAAKSAEILVFSNHRRIGECVGGHFGASSTARHGEEGGCTVCVQNAIDSIKPNTEKMQGLLKIYKDF